MCAGTLPHRHESEPQVTQGFLLRLVHAVGQLREDAVHVLEEGAKQHLLPARQQHRQLQAGAGSSRRRKAAAARPPPQRPPHSSPRCARALSMARQMPQLNQRPAGPFCAAQGRAPTSIVNSICILRLISHILSLSVPLQGLHLPSGKPGKQSSPMFKLACTCRPKRAEVPAERLVLLQTEARRSTLVLTLGALGLQG